MGWEAALDRLPVYGKANRERDRQPIIPIANLESQINVFAQWKEVSKSCIHFHWNSLRLQSSLKSDDIWRRRLVENMPTPHRKAPGVNFLHHFVTLHFYFVQYLQIIVLNSSLFIIVCYIPKFNVCRHGTSDCNDDAGILLNLDESWHLDSNCITENASYKCHVFQCKTRWLY